jgi:hypothetical protein
VFSLSNKNSFVLYADYWEHIQKLNNDERGILLTAIYRYILNCELPEMSGAVEMAFSFIRLQLERDNEKWENTRKERVEAGRLGGVASGKSRKQNEAN